MSDHNYAHQTILLSEEGIITTSTDELFSTKDLKSKDIQSNFPFVESIFPALSIQQIGQIHQFNKVKTIHTFLPGIYDYIFIKLQQCKNCQDALMWIIIDKTITYSELWTQQQTRQEVAIRRG